MVIPQKTVKQRSQFFRNEARAHRMLPRFKSPFYCQRRNYVTSPARYKKKKIEVLLSVLQLSFLYTV